MASLTTSWMWQDETSGTVMGVQADVEKGKLFWYDEPGCACTSADDEQPISDFIANGPRRIMPPDDILAEMQASLKQLA